MIRMTVIAISTLLLVLPAAAEQDGARAPDGLGKQFREVIEAQLTAFARDDARDAFSHASPPTQAIFGSPERFMSMVRENYPAIYRPQAVAFARRIRTPGGGHAQPVSLIGPDGLGVLAMYRMEEQPDGSWRIAGVQVRKVEERGT